MTDWTGKMRGVRLSRTAALVAVAAVFFAIGPWALVAGAVTMLVPTVRRLLWPTWRHAGVFSALIVAATAIVVVVPDGKLPIPPGGGLLVTPSFVGTSAEPKPISLEIAQAPTLAANGMSAMHNDAWSTDAYAGPGPLGRDPQIDTSWFGIEECATLAFDTQAQLIALCGRLSGPVLHVIDPESMDPVDSMILPKASPQDGKKRWEDLCGGAYFYLDKDDRAFVGLTDRRIAVVRTAGPAGEARLEVERYVDLTGEIPEDDCLIALMPEWNGSGTWWISQDGRVGLADEQGRSRVLQLGEEIANSASIDKTGFYVVTVDALYQLQAGSDGQPVVGWRTEYENSGVKKSGQLSIGSGTTPTVLPSGLVAINDNAGPSMNIQFYDLAHGALVCEAPVFTDRKGSSDNSLVAVGDAAVVVENNYGYDSPFSTMLGRAGPGGFARVDAIGSGTDRDCHVTWTSNVIAPTSVPKVSLETGLIYSYSTRPSRWGVQAWYISALDAFTGREIFAVRTGTGTLFNNHYSAVTLAPDGTLFVATLTGLVRLRDGR